MRVFDSLVTRSILGGILLLFSIVLMSAGHNLSQNLQTTASVWQTNADALTADLDRLGQLAHHYKNNAPRDFESYERDLAVFYQQFQQQLQTLESGYAMLTTTSNQLTDNPLYHWLNDAESPAITAINAQVAAARSWALFRNDLNDALGNLDEPRLEWGADRIIASEDALYQSTINLGRKIATARNWLNQRSDNVNHSILLLVALYVVLSFSTFLMFVIRPVVQTANACKHVADGEYGLRVKLNGSGETRQLQRAFNELSARAALMLNLVGQLSRSGNISDKLSTILSNSQEALGVNWVGFMELGTDGATLAQSVPPVIDHGWKYRKVSLNKSLGRQISSIGRDEWLSIDNLAEMSLKHHDERFLREMHKRTAATHVMGYGFQCPLQHRFVLLFTTKNSKGFDTHQQELLRALANLMVNAVIDGMDLEPAPSQPEVKAPTAERNTQTKSMGTKSNTDLATEIEAYFTAAKPQ